MIMNEIFSKRTLLRLAGGLGFLAFCLAVISVPSVSRAQSDMVLKVQPALFEQTVNPGDRFSTSLTVTNPSTAPRQFTVGVEDISGMTQGGQPIFTTSSVPQYGLSSWVVLTNTAITVPAGGSVVVPFTVTIPKNAGPGGHYGAIFVSSGAVHPTSNGAGLAYEVGALLEFRIAGNALEQAAITSFSTDSGLYQSPNVNFSTVVANQGNVLLQPRGPIDVTNMFGQKVGTVVVNDAGAAIFPGTNRVFSTNWTGNGFAFGQFTAVMTLNYGDTSNKSISASTSFWVIPVVPMVVVLGSIIFFVLIFVWSVKAYVRRRVRAMIGDSSVKDQSKISEEEKLLAEEGLPLSRLVFIVIATAIFALIFLLVLFFFFG
jgi:hypothetical protein